MSRHHSPVRPTLSTLNVDLPSLPSLASDDLASSSTSRGRSFSQVKLPSFRISTTGSPKSPSARSFGNERPSVTHQQDPTQKYRDESRKLLAHILGQLRDRTKPESVFNGFKSGRAYDPDSRDLRTTVRVIQGVVKLRAGLVPQARSQTSTQDDSDSDIEEGTFSTDATFNLLSQFVSALAVAVKAGWQIFDDGYETLSSCDKCAQSQLLEIHSMNHPWKFSRKFRDELLAASPVADHGPLHLSEGGPGGCPLQTSLHTQSLSSLPLFPRIVVSRSQLHGLPVLQMLSSPWHLMPPVTSCI